MKRFLKMAAIGVSVLLLGGLCFAQTFLPKVIGSCVAVASATATALTDVPTDAIEAMVTVRGGSISWRADGTDPEANNGNILSEGGVLILEGYDEITKFKHILNENETAGGVTVYGHYKGVR